MFSLTQGIIWIIAIIAMLYFGRRYRATSKRFLEPILNTVMIFWQIMFMIGVILMLIGVQFLHQTFPTEPYARWIIGYGFGFLTIGIMKDLKYNIQYFMYGRKAALERMKRRGEYMWKPHHEEELQKEEQNHGHQDEE